jgi:hypothetical protein
VTTIVAVTGTDKAVQFVSCLVQNVLAVARAFGFEGWDLYIS